MKNDNPLFDEYGSYRREAIRFQKATRLQDITMGAIAGLSLSTILVCLWLLTAG